MRVQSLCVVFAMVRMAHAKIEAFSCTVGNEFMEGTSTFDTGTYTLTTCFGLKGTLTDTWQCMDDVWPTDMALTCKGQVDSKENPIEPEQLEYTDCYCTESDDSKTCFPGNSTVELADGSFVSMDNLQVGDSVR